MNRKMQALALAGNCCGLGASGPATAAGCSFANNELKATVPNVAPSPYKNSRRLGRENGCMMVTLLREGIHHSTETPRKVRI